MPATPLAQVLRHIADTLAAAAQGEAPLSLAHLADHAAQLALLAERVRELERFHDEICNEARTEDIMTHRRARLRDQAIAAGAVTALRPLACLSPDARRSAGADAQD